MYPIRNVGFMCPTCGKHHPQELEAFRCCQGPLLHEDCWTCDECLTDHDGFREADACCRPEDERETLLSIPTPQELESAGQRRLFL